MYLYRVILERDVCVFGEGGRGEGRRRVVPDALGNFESGRGERTCGVQDAKHLRRHLILPCRVVWGVGEVGTPRIPDRGGFFLGPLLGQEANDCRAPFSLNQEGEEGRDMFQVKLGRFWE